MPKIISFSGLLRVGKNSFADSFCQIGQEEFPNLKFRQFSFANHLRVELDSFLMENFGISAFTQNPKEKEIIRPFLIAHGNARRKTTNNQYWIEKLDKDIFHSDCDVAVLSDLRFYEDENDERGWLKQRGGKDFHIKRYIIDGQQATFESAQNEYEKENDPKLEAAADKNILLERFEKDEDFYSAVDEICRDLVMENFNYLSRG